MILCLCGTFLLYYERVSGLQPQCLVCVWVCVLGSGLLMVRSGVVVLGGGGGTTCHISQRKKRRVHVREHSRQGEKKEDEREKKERQGSLQQAGQCCVTGVS